MPQTLSALTPDGPTAPARRTLLLSDPEATDAFGTALGHGLRPGDTVLLSGPLGAGKSALARAAIRAWLGDPDAEVPSPSYTLVNVYDDGAAGEALWHADLYRLAEPEEAAELGLPHGAGEALLLVEWPERLAGLWPARRLEIALASTPQDTRRAELIAHGPGWEAALAAAAPWI
ncbi:MAG: tRNA (adenosine(37)-N6)-threonylcarbamoyltransferase complex ATPase subunit type 1 TsaE [Pseudomonadota bacterium]